MWSSLYGLRGMLEEDQGVCSCKSLSVVFLSQIQSCVYVFFFSSRRRHTRFDCDWSSDVCSSDLEMLPGAYKRVASLPGTRSCWHTFSPRGKQEAQMKREYQRWYSQRLGLELGEIGRASCRERV